METKTQLIYLFLIFSISWEQCSRNEYEDLTAYQRIYQKFLIGTEKCERLGVLTFKQLHTLAQVARTYPESLQQLSVVVNGCYVASSLVAAEPEVRDELLGMYCKVC